MRVGERWFSRRILPYRATGETVDGLTISFTEITEFKATLAAVRRHEARLQSLADEFPALVAYVSDPQALRGEPLAKLLDLSAMHAQTEAAHASRIASLNELAGTVTHKLSQPLGAIANYAAAFKRQLGDGRDPRLHDLADKLLERARDAPTRRLTLATACDDEHVYLSVADTGHGIAEEDRERIFNTFYTRKRDGMGMGLTICRGIVEEIGGTIGASAGESGGAVFDVHLPVERQ